MSQTCPCGTGLDYNDCCGRFLDQGAYPQRADLLMRSRFTAYVRRNRTYLIKTWHPDTCPALTENDLNGTEWLTLEVITHHSGLKKATVEFKAWYQTPQGAQCHHERSLFKKVKNRWVYLNPIAE
ncbi:YchJ family protein [Reinekea blandensis]|uniref:YchJ-like middle NTF2-like domain-containing protein n=1 Tax=Reinekea blandensis MED297 TaxID=314283 RepID=A4BGS3_9GAMM|nr:YchJ family metal-binding protein [Reinekea blandensis]EAR08721.1 hypothetical protein MED297_14435 [Reinekea sp. MED297] [Reinekea blandensis MED297]